MQLLLTAARANKHNTCDGRPHLTCMSANEDVQALQRYLLCASITKTRCYDRAWVRSDIELNGVYSSEQVQIHSIFWCKSVTNAFAIPFALRSYYPLLRRNIQARNTQTKQERVYVKDPLERITTSNACCLLTSTLPLRLIFSNLRNIPLAARDNG